MTITMTVRALAALATTLLLASCGGGGGGDSSSVVSMSASNARFGNTTVITVNSKDLPFTDHGHHRRPLRQSSARRHRL